MVSDAFKPMEQILKNLRWSLNKGDPQASGRQQMQGPYKLADPAQRDSAEPCQLMDTPASPPQKNMPQRLYSSACGTTQLASPARHVAVVSRHAQGLAAACPPMLQPISFITCTEGHHLLGITVAPRRDTSARQPSGQLSTRWEAVTVMLQAMQPNSRPSQPQSAGDLSANQLSARQNAVHSGLRLQQHLAGWHIVAC